MADATAALDRAIAELTRAAQQKAEFPGSFMAGTYTGFAVDHLRAAARHLPRPHRMRIARLAAGLRLEIKHTGRAHAAPSLTVAAIIAGEVEKAIEIRRAA